MTQSITKPAPLQVMTCTTECNYLTNNHSVRKLIIETPISYMEWYVLEDVINAYQEDLGDEVVRAIVNKDGRSYILYPELFNLEWQGDQEMIYHSVLQEIFLIHQNIRQLY